MPRLRFVCFLVITGESYFVANLYDYANIISVLALFRLGAV